MIRELYFEPSDVCRVTKFMSYAGNRHCAIWCVVRRGKVHSYYSCDMNFDYEGIRLTTENIERLKLKWGID